MSFTTASKQVTVVYADGYVSAANLIEARIQAFAGFKSRLWDVDDYMTNKFSLDSDQLVLFLGDLEENAAAKTYANVFQTTERACGCVFSIAGAKAWIYATGEAQDQPPPLDGAANFYGDSEGNTRSKDSFSQLSDTTATWRKAVRVGLGGVPGWLIDKLIPEDNVSRVTQLEAGCNAFMATQFANWVGFSPA